MHTSNNKYNYFIFISDARNYRGLSSIVTELYNRTILNRIRPVINPHLRVDQYGFCQNKTTVAQVLSLRRIIERARKRNVPAVLTFIYFKKAFNSIHRGKMFKILSAYGIPERLELSIKDVHQHKSQCCHQMARQLRRECFRAPFLFIIVLDYAMRQAIDGREEALLSKTSRRVNQR